MLGSSESDHTCIINQTVLALVAAILVKHVTLVVDTLEYTVIYL